MRLLITGGLGFLGHHITEHFLRTTDAKIIVLDKMTYASSGFDRLRDIQAYDDKRVHVLGCDLGHPIPPGVAREIGEVDYVIHAAAETHVDNSIADPLPFFQANVIGTHHLLWWTRSLKSLRRVFCIATDEVYGPASLDDKEHKFDENARYRPGNPYSAAKAGGECVAMAYANTYGLPITIASTMNLTGERQSSFGADGTAIVEKFIPLVIRRVLLGEKVLIHADSTGAKSGTRFYLHCRTFAHALHFLIDLDQRPGLDCPPEIQMYGMPLKIHVSGEREISNLELAQMIAGFIGKPLIAELCDLPSIRPGHDIAYRIDDSLIQSLGWQRPMGLDQSLKKTVAWYLANPKWLGL
jgi:dTDP-glucose 4,6-dehydratase